MLLDKFPGNTVINLEHIRDSLNVEETYVIFHGVNEVGMLYLHKVLMRVLILPNHIYIPLEVLKQLLILCY